MGDLNNSYNNNTQASEEKPRSPLPEGLPKEVYELHSRSSDPEKMRKQIEQLGVERTSKLFEEYKNSSQEKPSAEEFTASAVKVNEIYGPRRPGRPDADIRQAATEAAAAAGMSNINFTSGVGKWISPSGRAKGQSSTVHSTGKALDVTGFANDAQRLKFIEEMEVRGVKGVGVYRNGSVHVDFGRKNSSWAWEGSTISKKTLEATRAKGRERRAAGEGSNYKDIEYAPQTAQPIAKRGMTSWDPMAGLDEAGDNTSSVDEAPKKAGESMEQTPLTKGPKPPSMSPSNKPKTVDTPQKTPEQSKPKPDMAPAKPSPVERKPIGPTSESKIESYDSSTKAGVTTASNKRAYSRATGISMGDGHFDGSVA